MIHTFAVGGKELTTMHVVVLFKVKTAHPQTKEGHGPDSNSALLDITADQKEAGFCGLVYSLRHSVSGWTRHALYYAMSKSCYFECSYSLQFC